MHGSIEDFLTPEEEQQVIDAIREAEDNTSGESRVHLEASCHGDAMKRAQEVFSILDMHNTRLQNAVLIYVAVNDNRFAILASTTNSSANTNTQPSQTNYDPPSPEEPLLQGIPQELNTPPTIPTSMSSTLTAITGATHRSHHTKASGQILFLVSNKIKPCHRDVH